MQRTVTHNTQTCYTIIVASSQRRRESNASDSSAITQKTMYLSMNSIQLQAQDPAY